MSRSNWPVPPRPRSRSSASSCGPRCVEQTGLVASVGRRIRKADRQDRLRTGQTRRDPGGPPRRGGAAARRPAGAQAVGHWAGGRGEAAPARHRDGRCVGRAVGCRGRQRARHGGRRRAASAGPRNRRSPGGRARRGQADQRRVDLSPRTSPRCVSLQDAIGPIGEHAHRRLEKDGRGARTVTVKLKKSDMSTLTRSATLAVRHHRGGHPDRHRPPAVARPGRDRTDPPCRRGLFGTVRQQAGIVVPGSGAARRHLRLPPPQPPRRLR